MRADRALICASAGVRACAVGLSGIILALHLATLHLNARTIGVIVALGLAGCAVGTWVVTVLADHAGRRLTLVVLAGLMSIGGAGLALASHPPLLWVAVFFGMVNGMGRDRGAGLTVEQVMLPQAVGATSRTQAFAWYNLTIDAGHALGSLLGGLPALLRAQAGCPLLMSYRWTWGAYSLLCALAAALAWRLSARMELSSPSTAAVRLSPASRKIVVKLSALYGLDSLGGGFLTTALLGYWFFTRFGVNEAVLGPLFCFARVANGGSHLAAAWLARRIGLIRTMVFTHLPSSLLLMTVPIAPSFPVAAALFLLRESLVEMDVPARQSYLVAVVRETERTRAAGITNLTRGFAWAVAPAFAGALMKSVSVSAPLVIGPGLKIAYDVLLYRAFRHVRPPEER